MLSRVFKHVLAFKPNSHYLFSPTNFTSLNTIGAYGTSRNNDPRKSSPQKKENTRTKPGNQSTMSKSMNSSIKKVVSKYNVKRSEKPIDPKFFENEKVNEEVARISAIPFDQLTAELAGLSPEEVKEKINEIRGKAQTKGSTSTDKNTFLVDFPWSFENNITKRSEENLKAPLEKERLIDHEVALKLLGNYVKALRSYDVKNLESLLEPAFLKKCSKSFDEMKEKGYKIVVENTDEEGTEFDLFKVSNFFCVGVSSNRKKNKSENAYYVFDRVIEECPIRHVVKKKLDGDEMAVIKVVLDFIVETPIRMKVVDKEGQVVEGEMNKEGGMRLHHMRIENDVLEILYKTLKRNMNISEDFSVLSIGNFKHVFSHENWRIIDFDDYMQGNDIVKPSVRLF